MYRGEHGVSGCGNPRAQSNVIAVVLLAGLVIAGATVVVVAGSAAINESSADVTLSTAEEGMLSMDQQLRQLSNEDVSEANIEFAGSAKNLRVATSKSTEAGVLKITVGATTEEYVLGTVKYERDGRIVAYQGGGVWRKTANEDGSTAVSAPPVSYRPTGGAETLSFPVVQLRGEGTGNDMKIETVDRKSLLSDLGLNRKVSPGTTITVEIKSEFYEGWADELEREVGSAPVSTVPAQEKVVVEFVGITGSMGGTIRGGAYSDGATSTISNAVTTNGYTSPTTSPTYGNGGHIRTIEEFNLKNSPDIDGDVHAMRGSSTLETSGGIVRGQVRLGCCAGPISMTNGQTYQSVFSTKDDFVVDGGSDFYGDVIVGGTGTHGNSYSLNVKGKATFHQDVHVDGTLRLEEAQKPTFQGNIYVKNGDVRTGKTKGQIDGHVYVKGGPSSNGDVFFGPDVKTVTIDGDLIAEGTVTLRDKVTVKGDVVSGGSIIKNGGSIQGSERGGGPVSENMPSTGNPDAFETPLEPKVPEREPVDTQISNRGSLYSSSNDNLAAGITGSSLASCGPCVIPSGNYYLDEIDLGSGDTLKLMTGGDTINVYVRDYVKLKGSTVEVRGGGRVNLWVGGHSTTGGNSFVMRNPAKVVTKDSTGSRTHRAPGLWTYLKKDDEAEMKGGNTEYTGVIYGPGKQKMSGGRRVSDDPGTKISIKNSVEIHGGIVGHVVKFDNSAVMHYDSALGGRTVVPGSSSPSTAPVGFISITKQSATVDD